MTTATAAARNGLYQPGQQVGVLADIFPANITPTPQGVPPNAKLRAVITEHALTILWSDGRGPTGPMIGRMDIPMTSADTMLASYRGGPVGKYRVGKAGGCGCGASDLKNFHPFPDVSLVPGPVATATPAPPADPAQHKPTRYSRV